MQRLFRWSTFIFLATLPYLALAGGSGLNIAVVVNQSSSNSIELGNYFCERRQIPPQNLLRINWPNGIAIWTRAEFETALATPLQAMLASRQLTNQIDFIALSMDIPYRITDDANGLNSTTSALFYGFKSDTAPPGSCSLAPNSSNAYAGSEDIFRKIFPDPTNFLATMLTASNLALAKQLVDQGVASDNSFPTQTVLLAKTSDDARDVRYPTFDNAIFNTRLRGNYSMQRVISDSPFGQTNLLGYLTGLAQFSISPNTFVPGAMADSLTSYAGIIFEPNDQTTVLAFTQAGASGSYGTVVEPCNYLEKFPSPQNYFYQARGFSLAECYYQSVTNPYQGLIVGEPLAAPFQQPSAVSWNTLPANSLLSGTTNLSVQFTASDSSRPVQQVDLFLDGTFLQTLTNIPPRQNNVLNVTLNGRSMNYTVPSGATIKSVAVGLVGVLNFIPNQNATKVQATVHGDRIELQSFDSTKLGSQIPISVSSSIGSASALTTFITASGTNFLDSVAWGIREFHIVGTPLLNDFLQVTVTKTNGAQVTVSVTNSAGANLTQLAQQFLNAINATSSLQGNDGLAGEDLALSTDGSIYFNLRARGQGFTAAQIQVAVTGSLTFVITPIGTVKLDENLSDLQPRNHLYVSAGLANLSFSFPLDTTTQADGYRELTAVAYEGSHVRTQGRAARNVRIQNSSLSATFTTLFGGTNFGIESTLQFSVMANTNNISKIELFSTGGLLATVPNQSNTVFNVAGTNLGIGLHPFYVIVTDVNGQVYRTETKYIRLGTESVFSVQISQFPITLSWPAVAGHSYDVLSTTNLADPFQFRATVTATNSTAQWIEPDTTSPQRFYRIHVSP